MSLSIFSRINKSLLSQFAWNVNSYGGIEALTLSQYDIPSITRTNHVLVKVKAASVNPIDLMMIEGYGKRVFTTANYLKNANKVFNRHIFPLIPGRDFSGVVFDVGQDCEKFKIGDHVWGSLDVFEPRGSHSSFITVKESQLSHRPESISHVRAASVPFAANTLFGSLGLAGISKEDLLGSDLRCLVLGASGGVGSLAVQYLKYALTGGYVIATCKSYATSFVTSLNADYVIDSSKDDYLNKINHVADEGFDLVLNFLPTTDDGLLNQIICKKGAKFITTSSPLLRNIDSLGLVGVIGGMADLFGRYLKDRKFIYGFFRPDVEVLDYVGQLLSNNKITTVVDEEYNFESLPSAYYRLKQGGVLGKVVVKMED